MLVRNAGRLMPKEWLLDEVWSQVFVAEVNLSVTISACASFCGRAAERKSFIDTVPKSGYRFVAPVPLLQAPVAACLRPKKESPDGSAETRQAYLQGRYQMPRP
jgi:DNA-binding winged helix-turn-helix (wHTH) protein